MTSTAQAYEWVKTGHWGLRQFREWFDSQRQPMTDEQIVGIAQITCIGISPHEDAVNFARAIEAAHGIKESS